MFFPHLIGDAGPRQSRTSSAKGALGRHERHDSAGMRLAYCRGGIGVREDGGTGAGLRAGAVGVWRRRCWCDLLKNFHVSGLQFALTGCELLHS